MNRPRSDLTREELALAYELRQEGCCWKRIAQGLGCNADDIKQAVNHAIKYGPPHSRQIPGGGRVASFSPELLQAVRLMRWHGLGWGCIARYFSTTKTKIHDATRREK